MSDEDFECDLCGSSNLCDECDRCTDCDECNDAGRCEDCREAAADARQDHQGD